MSSNYIDLPSSGNFHWKGPVVLTIDLPANGNSIGDVRLAEDTNTIYVWNGISWIAVATPGAAIAITGLIGDVSAVGPGTAVATVNFVGGQSAAAIAAATILVETPQSGNKVLASPADGSSGVSTFRHLVSLDIPDNAANTTGTASNITASSNSTLTTLTALSLPSSQITGVLTIPHGGTGLSATPTDGQLLIGSTSGSNYVLSTLTAGTGIGITNSSGGITITNTSPSSGGTVTSVALTTPGVLYSVSGSPITTSGTLALSLISQSQNTVLAGPTSGSGSPSFRALVSADLPNYNTVTKTANYTILSTDTIIFANTSGGAFTLTLPSPTSLAGKIYMIIDTNGTFNTNNCTLAPSSTEKIEGLAASKPLQTNWGWFTITTNGTDWFVGG